MSSTAQPITITLTEADWMMVMAGMVEAARSPTVEPGDAAAYAIAGRKLADKFPKGSGPWFGGALLGTPDAPEE